LLPFGDDEVRAAVVRAFPDVEQGGRRGRGERVGEGGVAMGDEFELGGATGHVVRVSGDDPEANAFFGAGPAVGGRLPLDGGVVVLVLDLAGKDAGTHQPGFLHVHLFAVVPVVGGDHLHVAAGVHGHPVKDIVVELGGEAADGKGEFRIVGVVLP